MKDRSTDGRINKFCSAIYLKLTLKKDNSIDYIIKKIPVNTVSIGFVMVLAKVFG